MKVTSAQITQRASSDGVSAKVVERDYALAHAVHAIASANSGNILVFKGGFLDGWNDEVLRLWTSPHHLGPAMFTP